MFNINSLQDYEQRQEENTESETENTNNTGLGLTKSEKINFTLLAYFYALMDKKEPGYLRIIFWISCFLIISPFDLCPDFAAWLGYIDDILLTLLASIFFKVFLAEERRTEHYKKAVRSNSHSFWDKAGCILIMIMWSTTAYLSTQFLIFIY